MTEKLMVVTFIGGFIFPFMVSMCWGKMVETWGAIGGWMAAGFIVGTTWALNHYIPLIYQSGHAWIDQAWAAGFGLLAGAVFSGASIAKAMPTVICSIIGGTLGGFILSLVLKH